MRSTTVLYAMHIGRLANVIWHKQGKIQVKISKAEEFLSRNNIKVYQMQDLDPPKPLPQQNIPPYIPLEMPKDKHHPDWKSIPCFMLNDNDLLVEGLDQAKALTNSEEINDLPEELKELESKTIIPEELHLEAKNKIMHSCIYDTTQQKLPPRKDPLRPAYKFPRDLGITDDRKIKLLIRNLVQLCEQYVGFTDRNIVENAFFSVPLVAFKKNMQFEFTGDLVIRSHKSLTAYTKPSGNEVIPVPDMYPLDCTVGLEPYNFYSFENIYPFLNTSMFPFVHTVFLSFNKTEVKNIFEEEVTPSQIIGRNLMKAFGIAAAQAQRDFGVAVQNLISPVVVQIIMTDGELFHFSVFQLNTLKIDDRGSSSLKNIYWNSPIIPLYNICNYLKGRPTLQKYNPEVLKRIISFYKMESYMSENNRNYSL